ncbi:hypothetical protein B0H17DRAFT_1136466 [Mycena rosella]|uniref:Uncharacterized protein n=1 Tax=Mycena rosella TaxID=1033263 RepID=A0AAD7DAN9_MYCRO|nr:hypothetical protein B0H17DRAFT_1136466 [Mycena rosella]
MFTTDGAKALKAMFSAIHFRRDDPSFSTPTKAIPVIVKHPGERPKKWAKVGILGNQFKLLYGKSAALSSLGKWLYISSVATLARTAPRVQDCRSGDNPKGLQPSSSRVYCLHVDGAHGIEDKRKDRKGVDNEEHPGT